MSKYRLAPYVQQTKAVLQNREIDKPRTKTRDMEFNMADNIALTVASMVNGQVLAPVPAPTEINSVWRQ